MSERARCCCIAHSSRVNQTLYLGVPAPSSISDSPASQRPFGLVWSGVNNFVRGTWRPPSFVGKLLSGKRDQGDRDCVHGRDLVAGSNTLRECFNNMDVGAPLWQSEPRDKSLCREFASSHPSFKLPHLFLQLVCLYSLSVVFC